MASHNTQNSSSRIPVASPISHTTDLYSKEIEENIPPVQKETHSRNKENGNLRNERVEPGKPPGHGFETFLMTGEMIIRTNPSKSIKSVEDQNPVSVKNSKGSHIPKIGQTERIPSNQRSAKDKSLSSHAAAPSPLLSSKIPGLKKNYSPSQKQETPVSLSTSLSSSETMAATPNESSNFAFVHAPVAELEEFSDLSQSSCSEGESTLENGHHSHPGSPQSLPHKHIASTSPQSHKSDTSRLEKAMESLEKMQSTLPDMSTPGLSDTSFSEPPSSGDSGFIHDGHTSDTDGPDKIFASNLGNALSKAENDGESNETLIAKEAYNDESVQSGKINSHHGPSFESLMGNCCDEKFNLHGNNTDRTLVRTSKSHENYLQGGTSLALVNIDIDDNLAYSLDALTYRDSSTSIDKPNLEAAQISKSLDNSPEKRDKLPGVIEREFVPGFINLENIEQRPKMVEESLVNNSFENNEINTSNRLRGINNSFNSSMYHQTASHRIDNGNGTEGMLSTSTRSDALNLSVMSDESSDADSVYHQPSKAVDRPSAVRLAKRLFLLEGFKKSDVSRHLYKKNDFSNLVAEEYLKFFDFQEDTLDLALRKFLIHFSLYGETQERERVLTHFSRRFMECNPGSFNSEDACHTLTCAIMLLNSDLHAPNVGRRMTCQEFIENLAELNDGENFSKEVLKAIYQAIKSEPIEWAVDDNIPELETQPPEGGQPTPPSSPLIVGSNPFLDVPDPSKTTEYKKGYVMRKCCMEPDRRKTPFGKRGWKMTYAVLRDLILYQFKDEHQLKKGQYVESSHNAIRVHHSLATKATDYTKKQHVFRLQTAEWSEYLFQTGDSKELQEWIDTINLVAATLSAPPLPGAVGSKMKFQRPLLPSSVTSRSLKEQLYTHETKFLELEQELQLHRTAAPEKGAKASVIQEYLDKETYLEFEIKRFRTYVYLLQGKLTIYPELEPSLVETTIGEYEEMETTRPSVLPPLANPSASAAIVKGLQAGGGKPVRSLSDSLHVNGRNEEDEEGEADSNCGVTETQLDVNEQSECTRM